MSHDIFVSQFRPLLPLERADSIEEIVSDQLKAVFRRYKETVLLPGGNVESHLAVLGEFLGRDPNPKAFIEMLKEMARRGKVGR